MFNVSVQKTNIPVNATSDAPAVDIIVQSSGGRIYVSGSNSVLYEISENPFVVSIGNSAIQVSQSNNSVDVSVLNGSVSSVNGETGDVVLSADDVGAIADSPIDGNTYGRKDGTWTQVSFTQINADWNSVSGVSEILNKPAIPNSTSDLTNDSNFVSDASYVHTDNNFTSILKTKLDGIQDGAEVNVNADWNAISGDAQILNKPSIPDQLSDLSDDATHRTVTDTEKSTWNGKQDSLGYTPENILNKENSVIDTSTVKYPTINLLKTGLDGKQNSLGFTPVNKAGDTMTGDLNVPDEVYGAGWNGSTEVPTKNALFDKIETLGGSSYVPVINTEDTILNGSPTSGLFGFSTDKNFFYVANGTNWYRLSLKLYSDTINPDAGYAQNNAKDGYYETFISDKGLYNIAIKGFTGTPVNGAIRVNPLNTPNTLEIYMRNTAWYTILYDFTTANGDLRHTPVSESMYVWRGDSVSQSPNGQPNIQEYKVNMGSVSSYMILDGGYF